MTALCVCVSLAGHGFLPGGASPAGDPRPPASLLRQPGRAAAPSAQKLRHEERRPGQVRLEYKLSWESVRFVPTVAYSSASSSMGFKSVAS